MQMPGARSISQCDPSQTAKTFSGRSVTDDNYAVSSGRGGAAGQSKPLSLRGVLAEAIQAKTH